MTRIRFAAVFEVRQAAHTCRDHVVCLARPSAEQCSVTMSALKRRDGLFRAHVLKDEIWDSARLAL